MYSSAHLFANRTAAGVALAAAIRQRGMAAPGLVIGLPRGGVPVAFEIARALQARLDVMPVRKIGMPGNPECAIGAIAGRTVVQEADLSFGVPTQLFAKLVRAERAELRRRERAYRADLPPLDFKGLDVLLVDDGLATGCTMLAAIREANRLSAVRVLVAAPVASGNAHALVRAEADEVIALRVEPHLTSVGEWYEDFSQVDDAQVCELLTRPPAATSLHRYAG